MKRLGLLLAALLALGGEAPAAPVRHLEYAFAIYPVAKPNGGAYNGTMTVDILGAAADGGLLVRASDWWYYALRPRQAVECEVYANGDVHCDNVPPYPSESALVLFPLLAQNFFSRGSPTGASSWRQEYKVAFAKGLFVSAISMNLKATPQGDGRFVIVKSEGTIRQLDGRQRYATEEGEFIYDRAASVPLVVHDARGHLPTESVYSRTAVDLRLLKDSASTMPQPSTQPRFQVNQPFQNGVPNVPLSAPLPKVTGAP
jgi:hypothetical protein